MKLIDNKQDPVIELFIFIFMAQNMFDPDFSPTYGMVRCYLSHIARNVYICHGQIGTVERYDMLQLDKDWV